MSQSAISLQEQCTSSRRIACIVLLKQQQLADGIDVLVEARSVAKSNEAAYFTHRLKMAYAPLGDTACEEVCTKVVEELLKQNTVAGMCLLGWALMHLI